MSTCRYAPAATGPNQAAAWRRPAAFPPAPPGRERLLTDGPSLQRAVGNQRMLAVVQRSPETAEESRTDWLARKLGEALRDFGAETSIEFADGTMHGIKQSIDGMSEDSARVLLAVLAAFAGTKSLFRAPNLDVPNPVPQLNLDEFARRGRPTPVRTPETGMGGGQGALLVAVIATALLIALAELSRMFTERRRRQVEYQREHGETELWRDFLIWVLPEKYVRDRLPTLSDRSGDITPYGAGVVLGTALTVVSAGLLVRALALLA